MPMIKFGVHAESKHHAQVEVTARNFKMIVDEPPNLGGTDEGANPVEYVLAALAGCLNVVGHMVAKEMGFEIKALSFDIVGELDPAGFMGKAKDVRPGYQTITVKVSVDTDADAATVEKWLETIENRCPVSDNLQHQTPVNIVLA
ncbi:MAG TPA: OsmC family protein [Thermotogota bacterium]|nr:OsmC family protein [Thermotogota bacterium]HPJ88047.1 OsmC family protein [Thermotogota bacterium]HPR96232.1 OsmC family protein [Thermotogota bacterium]